MLHIILIRTFVNGHFGCFLFFFLCHNKQCYNKYPYRYLLLHMCEWFSVIDTKTGLVRPWSRYIFKFSHTFWLGHDSKFKNNMQGIHCKLSPTSFLISFAFSHLIAISFLSILSVFLYENKAKKNTYSYFLSLHNILTSEKTKWYMYMSIYSRNLPIT